MAKNHEIKSLPDIELLNAFFLKKENRYLGELLDRYVRFVFVVCMKYLQNEEEAKDMSMQVFEKVTHDVHRFEIQNFKSWLHVVTKNSCLMHLRSNKKIKTATWDDRKDLTLNVETRYALHLEDSGEKEVRLVELEKSVKLLEVGQKQCIELFYLKGKSYVEVAEITGLTLNQVKSNIQNGKRNLKNLLLANSEFILMVFISLYLN